MIVGEEDTLIANVRNVSVSAWGAEKFCVRFVMGENGNRYHYFLNDGDLQLVDPSLYCNPGDHVGYRKKGWFPPRKYKIDPNRPGPAFALYTHVQGVVTVRGLIDKARKANATVLAKDHQEIADSRKIARMHTSGPQLYAALKAFLDCQEGKGVIDFKTYQKRRLECYEALKLVDEEP